MRITLDPKRDFIASGKHERHTSLMESSDIQDSLQAAFAQFCLVKHAETPLSKADAFSQIEGARSFIDLWLNLGRTTEPRNTDLRQLKPIDR